MKISGEVRWTIEGLTMEPRLVMLLESIARTGNLQTAAKTTGLSYRHAWGLLEAAGNQLGESLVVPQQGKGSMRRTSSIQRFSCQSFAARAVPWKARQ